MSAKTSPLPAHRDKTAMNSAQSSTLRSGSLQLLTTPPTKRSFSGFRELVFQSSHRSLVKLRLQRILFHLLGPRFLYLARFFAYHNRLPRFFSPVRMTDKLALRILSQQCSSRRRELTDKLRCREIVRKICPELRIKKVYGIYERPEQFSLAALPRSFVLKPNGASGLDMMVLDKRAASEEELRRTIAEWLRINYFESTQEPSYRGIKNKVFAEELILSEENYYPLELCIFCFHRKARFVDYDMDPNVPDHSELFDTDWNPLCIEYSHEQLDPMRMGCPPRLKEAIQVAERLAEGLDFVRVDLYDLPDGLAFGEMTSYPWGGLVKLSPPGADESLGRYWEPYSASPVDCVKFRSCSRDRRIRSKGPGTE